MKIVFLSNFFNHHQSPFCLAMYKRLGEGFNFIQTTEIEAERLNMGWIEENDLPFLKKSYAHPSAETECRVLINDADVVITGSAPESFVSDRIKAGKIVVRYHERLLKQKVSIWKMPYLYYRLHQRNPKKANIYLLCASAYTSVDYAKFGLFKNKSYKWGYFPEVKTYSDINKVIDKKEKNSIIWVARLIELKHPEVPILLAKRLKDEGYDFNLKLIGNGVLEEKLQNLIAELGISDCVKMLGAMKPWQVREYMEVSQIFLFTSDRNEGWGAVLNEAMNSGCGVIASDAIGSVPYLISDGNNGLMYRDGDFEDLYTKVKRLINEPETLVSLGRKAYDTMISEWNAEVAADRLLLLLEDLQNFKESDRYFKGPCSRA